MAQSHTLETEKKVCMVSAENEDEDNARLGVMFLARQTRREQESVKPQHSTAHDYVT